MRVSSSSNGWTKVTVKKIYCKYDGFWTLFFCSGHTYIVLEEVGFFAVAFSYVAPHVVIGNM